MMILHDGCEKRMSIKWWMSIKRPLRTSKTNIDACKGNFNDNNNILKFNYYHNHYYHRRFAYFSLKLFEKTHTSTYFIIIIIVIITTNIRRTRNQLKTMAVKLL